jgi:hypothetical protein
LLRDLDAVAKGRRGTFPFDERVAAWCRDEQQVPFGGALISSARLRRRLIRLARDRASRAVDVWRRLVLRGAVAEVGLIGLALERRNVALDQSSLLRSWRRIRGSPTSF